MKIAIIVPMEIEERYYQDKFTDFKKENLGPIEVEIGKYGQHEIYLTLSGIGKVQAGMTTGLILNQYHPDLLIMTGSAGSLKDDVIIKDLVIASEFLFHDVFAIDAGNYVMGQMPGQPATFKTNDLYRERLEHILDEMQIGYHEGAVATGDQFVAQDFQKAAITDNFPNVMAVEMEGAAIAQVAKDFNVPFIGIRSISDNGDENANVSFDEFVEEAGKKAANIVFHLLDELA